MLPTRCPQVLDDYLSESVDITNEFVDELLARSPEKAKEPIDVQEDLEVLTLKILLQSVFSTKTKDKGKWGHAFCEATKRCEDWVAQRIDKPLHLVVRPKGRPSLARKSQRPAPDPRPPLCTPLASRFTRAAVLLSQTAPLSRAAAVCHREVNFNWARGKKSVYRRGAGDKPPRRACNPKED